MLSQQNRGFQYGDGLFETMVVEGSEILLWDYHFARLQRGLDQLGIELEQSHLVAELKTQLEAFPFGVLKLIVTRGHALRGYNPTRAGNTELFWQTNPLPQYPTEWFTHGVDVRVCDLTLARQPALAGIKHLNRLEQVLARGEWENPHIAEGLLFDQEGYLIEGTCSNIVVVKGQSMFTPKLSHCGVQGVMRDYLIQQVPHYDLTLREVPMKMEQLKAADEVFLCNSVFGIWPVTEIRDVKQYAFGGITRALQYKLHQTFPWMARLLEGVQS